MDAQSAAYFPSFEQAAIENLLNQWVLESPRCGVFALVAESDKRCIAQLQALCRRVSIPLLGAIFPELINRGELSNQGLVVAKINSLLHYAICRQITSSQEGNNNCVSSIVEISKYGQSENSKHTLILVIDAMVPKIASLLEKIYFRLGDSVNYMGVNCGSETFKPMPCLFDSNELVEDAVLAFTIPNKDGAILEHGYLMPNEMIAATSTDNNCIVTINWRPAFDVYSELVQKQYGVKITKENFYENAVHFPFGVVRADSEVLVRIPVALQDDGSLFCVGEVPEHAVLTLLKAEDADSHTTVQRLVDNFSENTPGTLLTFYCAGRRMHMGERASAETRFLQNQLSTANVIGALSLGEIGSSTKDGYPLFHNATLVCTAWGDEKPK